MEEFRVNALPVRKWDLAGGSTPLDTRAFEGSSWSLEFHSPSSEPHRICSLPCHHSHCHDGLLFQRPNSNGASQTELLEPLAKVKFPSFTSLFSGPLSQRWKWLTRELTQTLSGVAKLSRLTRHVEEPVQPCLAHRLSLELWRGSKPYSSGQPLSVQASWAPSSWKTLVIPLDLHKWPGPRPELNVWAVIASVKFLCHWGHSFVGAGNWDVGNLWRDPVLCLGITCGYSWRLVLTKDTCAAHLSFFSFLKSSFLPCTQMQCPARRQADCLVCVSINWSDQAAESL